MISANEERLLERNPHGIEPVKQVLRHARDDPAILRRISKHAAPQLAACASVENLGRRHGRALCNGRSDATRHLMRNVFRNVVSFALPPRCAGCGQIVSDDLQLCAPCWQSLDLLTGNGCERCGAPLAPDVAICAPCLKQAPDHDGAYAVAIYGDLARDIALKLKHGRRIGLARLIARLLMHRIPQGPGLLIPVPAHRWRIFRRGFNQSALIAQHLARASGLPLHLDVLLRTRSTALLRGANARERDRIVRGAFSVLPQFRNELAGKTVFLVDDVYTSGATANACARALKRSGAEKVFILCWARVPFGRRPD